MNGREGRNLHPQEARERRRSYARLIRELGPAWEYDGRGPSLCGTFTLGDGAVCCDRCLIELAGRSAPEAGIHPLLEVCDGKMALTLTPELGAEPELSPAALHFAVEWDGAVGGGEEVEPCLR